MDTITNADVMDYLATLPDDSVHCVVTSPPYFALRNYQVDGQIGNEPTPDEFVLTMIRVFREVRRVLRPDGCMFLNLGDSYSSGVQRANAYDISGKVPEDYSAHGCLCGNLCDVCRAVYYHTTHIDNWLAPMLDASLSESNRESMGLPPGHLPTWDSIRRATRIFLATQDQAHGVSRAVEQIPASLASTLDESSRQLLALYFQRANHDECLWCARSFSGSSQAFAGKTGAVSSLYGRTSGSGPHDGQPAQRSQYSDTACAYCAALVSHDPPYIQPDYTAYRTKEKDLLGIPWRVALSLQQDGWYLRSDIVWAKPNAMPESVTDRPARVHEYIFLLTKQPHYWYDYMAIREKAVNGDPSHPRGSNGTDTPNAGRRDKQGESGLRRYEGFNERWEASAAPLTHRNARSLWMITTTGSGVEHFAMFPRELVKRCLSAGCPRTVCAKCGAPYTRVLEKHRNGKGWNEGDGLKQGNRKSKSQPKDYQPPTTRGWLATCECNAATDSGVVLDPFMGSGTTALVARSMDRHWLGCDLNAEYVALANQRLTQSDPFEDREVAPNITQLSMF